MPAAFEWDIEEQAGPPRKISKGLPPPKRPRRWLLRGAILLIVLFLIALGVRVWIVSRLNTVEKVEQSLRSVVQMELKTISSGDTELFRTVQDPSDPIWQERQVNRYFSDQAHQFVPAPGLSPAARSSEIKTVQFLGTTARVDLVQWFQEPSFHPTEEHPEPNSAQLAEPYPFELTWFYRVDQDGTWYHIAPPNEYLGIPHSWHGMRLDILATEIEAASIDPAAEDWAILVSQVCLWLNCPEEVRYALSFEDALTPQVQGARWALPALYLTGSPDTAEGRAAWQRAVGKWVLGALAQSLVEDSASRNNAQDITRRIIYDQLVARIASALGISEPMAPDVDLLTQAVRDRRQHSLEELWLAKPSLTDPKESDLLKAETGALLDLITSKRGDQQLFLLLPALRNHDRLSTALPAVLDLDTKEFTAAWYAYLSDLTGATVLASQLTPERAETGLPDLPFSPPVPAPPQIPPGDHLAFICAGQIWASNADGSDLVSLTSSQERFKYLHWSPNGRWLLTTWQPDVPGGSNVLYLLDADGGDGHPLPQDVPVAQILPIGWSPNGQEVIYAMWHKTATFPMEIRAVDVESGKTRVLPGLPSWSPDGAYLNYVANSYGSAWLASGDWNDAHRIADRAWAAWQGGSWAPDGSKVALQLDKEGGTESTLVVFDLATQKLTRLISSANLTAAFQSYQGPYIADDANPDALTDRPLRWIWPFGWSADGSHILVWAHRSDRTAAGKDLSVLGVVPMDGSAPKALAYVRASSLGSAAWSPTDPNRVAFTWLPEFGNGSEPTSFLFDLESGPLYSGAQNRNAAWSPDGAWIALDGPDEVVIVDQEGHERYTLKPRGDASCSHITWNPTADLSRLRESAVVELIVN